MAVRAVTKPASSRSRRSKFPFSDQDVKDACKLLKEGKTPGVGPFEGEKAIREARSAAGSLIRHVNAVEPDLTLGTESWENEDGTCEALVKVKQ